MLVSDPTRGANLSRGGAAALGIALLTILAVLLLRANGSAGEPIDGSVQASLIEAVRHGGDFYPVASDFARAGASIGGMTRLPLPSLSLVLARVPLAVGVLMLWGLAAGTLYAWAAALSDALAARNARTVALLLLFLGMSASLDPARVEARELWAGLLVALSLARWRPERALESVALGLAAALVADLAGVYLLAMALVAAGGGRREAFGWAAAAAIYGLVLLLHAHASPALPAIPGAHWGPVHAAPAWLAALAASSALGVLPLALAVPLLALSAIGWLLWASPRGTRGAAVLAAFTALAWVAPPDRTAGIALITAPLWPLGLLFVPDGLRGIAGTVLDKRRITVTRVVR